VGLVIAILIVALILGVLGVIIEGLLWLLVVAVIVAIGAFVVGRLRGGSRRTGGVR
jgi:hypothetical protein